MEFDLETSKTLIDKHVGYISKDMLQFLNKHLIEKGIGSKIKTLKEFEGLSELDIIKRYILIIISISKKCSLNGIVDRDDLVMEGIIGLLDAIKRYDPERNENFHNLALVRITGEMYKYSMNNKHSISVPMYLGTIINHIEKIKSISQRFTNDHEVINNLIYGRNSHRHLDILPQEARREIERTKKKIDNILKVQFKKETPKEMKDSYKRFIDEAIHGVYQLRFNPKSVKDFDSGDRSDDSDGDGFFFIPDNSLTPYEEFEVKEIKERLIEMTEKQFRSKTPVDIVKLLILESLTPSEIHKRLDVTPAYVQHVLNVFKRRILKDFAEKSRGETRFGQQEDKHR